jgi:hypothetical protein
MRGLAAGLILLIALNGAPRGARQAAYTPPQASADVLRGVDFSTARPLDETYRAEFDRCDRENNLRGRADDPIRQVQ